MKITWNDITVANANELKDFYSKVLGWETVNLPIEGEGYNDYLMVANDDPESAIAGICHKKGPNKNLPPVWIPYVEVSDLDLAIKNCKEGGGKLIDGPRAAGEGTIAIIQDIADGYMGLYQG